MIWEDTEDKCSLTAACDTIDLLANCRSAISSDLFGLSSLSRNCLQFHMGDNKKLYNNCVFIVSVGNNKLKTYQYHICIAHNTYITSVKSTSVSLSK